MQIGELAERTGISRRMLRHYEQHGLLEARRDSHGWRDYDEAAVERVRRIAELVSGGLTLEGVHRMAPCLERGAAHRCDDPDLPVRTYRERLAVLDERLAHLHRQHDELTRRLRSAQPD